MMSTIVLETCRGIR